MPTPRLSLHRSPSPAWPFPLLTLAVLGLMGLAGLGSLGACSDASPGGAAGDGDVVAGQDGVQGDGQGTDDGASPDGEATDVADLDVPTCPACEAPKVCANGWCVDPEPGGCTPGETRECYGTSRIMTCDPTGQAFSPVDCPSSHKCQNDSCTPVLCVPGQWICEGLTGKKQCNEDGTGFLEVELCGEAEYCSGGKCGSTCSDDPKFGSYLGCAYWTVDLPNWPDPTMNPTPQDLPHVVIISNPGEFDAEITFEPPPEYTVEVDDNVIPGGGSKIFMMPVMNVDHTGISTKAIRFTSTRPVLVHQFNPWQSVYSNDASLLLPETFLGTEYVVASWPTDARGLSPVPIPGMDMPNVNGFFTVVAIHDDTEVTFTVTGRVAAGPGVDAMEPGDTQTVTLNKGEVLNVEGEPAKFTEVDDLTGSTVTANKSIMVFAGQESAGIQGDCCLDHLEEMMLPKEVLGTDYLAVKSKPRGGEVDLWRIIAAEDNVTLTTDPPLGGVNGVTMAKRGQWVQVATSQSFALHATGKVQVAQYLVSQGATNQGTGDPSLMLPVPAERFRDFYVAGAPPGYAENWLTVIKQAADTVGMAGGTIPQSEFMPIGGSGWEYAYVEVTAGVHKLAGSGPFGLIAYGYGPAVSYGYTGGMADGL